MKLSVIFGSLVTTVAPAIVVDEQHPLSGGPEFDLIKELKIAEIIPTVFDEFKPFLKLAVDWQKASAEVGNIIKPKKVQDIPKVRFLDHLPEFFNTTSNEIPQLTLVLTDPDARSRDDPDWSQMCHWIATDISIVSKSEGAGHDVSAMKHFTEIVPYKPPAPPKKTGKHRYVFAALAPKNGTSAKLHLSKPADRQHWGYGVVRAGVREWAEENGLTVVGANFFYAQHKRQ